MAAVTVKDNFAGESFNAANWAETDAGNHLSCNDNVLWAPPGHTTPHSATLSGAGKALAGITGDFDMQISYQISSFPGYNPQFALQAVVDGNTYAEIYVVNDSGFYRYGALAYNDDGTLLGTGQIDSRNDATGKLRIVRTTSTVVCYCWYSSNWQQVGSFANFSTGAVYPAFRFLEGTSNAVATNITMDDYSDNKSAGFSSIVLTQ